MSRTNTDLAPEVAGAGQGVESCVVPLLAAVARAAAHVLGALAVLLALVKLESVRKKGHFGPKSGSRSVSHFGKRETGRKKGAWGLKFHERFNVNDFEGYREKPFSSWKL